MRNVTRIVVGLDLAAGERLPPRGRDLSPACRAALDRALRLARASRSLVHAVYVAEADDAARDLLLAGTGRHAFVAGADRRLDELIAPARAEGAAILHDVAFGRPWKVLLAAALADAADAVVVGTPVRGPAEGRALGTNAMELIRACPVPVWVARPGADEHVRRVVAAVEDDGAAASVARRAAEAAEEHGAALDLVHVVDDAPERLLRADGVPADTLGAYRAARMEAAHGFLVALAERDLGAARAPRLHVLRGEPAAAIAAFVHEVAAELVVLGKAAHGALTDPRPGPTAERLLGTLGASSLLVVSAPAPSARPSS